MNPSGNSGLLPPRDVAPLAIPPSSNLGIPIPQNDVEAGQVLLLFKDPPSTQQVLNTLASEQIQPIATTQLPTLGWSLALFQFASHAIASQQLAQWQLRFPQAVVDYNYLYRAQSEDSGREYALSMLDLPKGVGAANASSVSTYQGLSATRIGMLDTHVEHTTWLRAATLVNMPFASTPLAGQVDRPAHPAHGTAIASLIARVAPTVQLFAAAVMAARGDQTVATSYRLIQGVDWLLEKRVQVINMSMSGRYDKNFATTITELMQRRVLVTAAAGNQGGKAPPAYPAAYASTHNGILAVTAVDVEGKLYSQANHGAYISVAAPGVNLWVPGALNPLLPESVSARYVSGTSYASAYAAGAVAHWLAIPQKSSDVMVPQRFCQTAKDLGPPGRDDAFGCGLLQINAALKP